MDLGDLEKDYVLDIFFFYFYIETVFPDRENMNMRIQRKPHFSKPTI